MDYTIKEIIDLRVKFSIIVGRGEMGDKIYTIVVNARHAAVLKKTTRTARYDVFSYVSRGQKAVFACRELRESEIEEVKKLKRDGLFNVSDVYSDGTCDSYALIPFHGNYIKGFIKNIVK